MVKHDIDIALDDMTGLEFARHLQEHMSKRGANFSGFGIIQPNAEKSKHLETGQEAHLLYLPIYRSTSSSTMMTTAHLQ